MSDLIVFRERKPLSETKSTILVEKIITNEGNTNKDNKPRQPVNIKQVQRQVLSSKSRQVTRHNFGGLNYRQEIRTGFKKVNRTCDSLFRHDKLSRQDPVLFENLS